MRQNIISYSFSPLKNEQLIKERGISFEEVIEALENDAFLDRVEHHNLDKYPNQEIYIIEMNDYVYLVPFVQRNKYEIFLKTIFPSRKLTKKHLKNKDD